MRENISFGIGCPFMQIPLNALRALDAVVKTGQSLESLPTETSAELIVMLLPANHLLTLPQGRVVIGKPMLGELIRGTSSALSSLPTAPARAP